MPRLPAPSTAQLKEVSAIPNQGSTLNHHIGHVLARYFKTSLSYTTSLIALVGFTKLTGLGCGETEVVTTARYSQRKARSSKCTVICIKIKLHSKVYLRLDIVTGVQEPALTYKEVLILLQLSYAHEQTSKRECPQPILSSP
jgi:hypothetical protein